MAAHSAQGITRGLILYAENPPTADGVVSTGLSRANRHIFDALADTLVGALSVSLAIRHPLRDAELHLPYQRLHHWLFRYTWRPGYLGPLLAKIRRRDEHVPRSELTALARHFGGRSDAVFAAIGANSVALGRARSAAQALGVPLIAYLVDDPVSAAELAGRPLTSRQFAEYGANLAACAGVVCITAELAALVRAEHGVQSNWAALPYERKIPATQGVPRTHDVVFIGSTSHFYQEGLEDCAKAVVACRRAGLPVRLVCTIQSPHTELLRSRYGEEVVHVQSCRSDADLDRLLAAALLAFMPYSFDSIYARMVATSFPSKLTEYLASARHILVYGPSYSSSARFLMEEKLEAVVTERSVDRLAAELRAAAARPQDFSDRYRNLVATRHSGARFQQVVLDAVRAW